MASNNRDRLPARPRIVAVDQRGEARPTPITPDEIARAARELVDAYGPGAIALMQKRTHAVRRLGDAESATLWSAVAAAVEAQLAAGAQIGPGAAGDD